MSMPINMIKTIVFFALIFIGFQPKMIASVYDVRTLAPKVPAAFGAIDDSNRVYTALEGDSAPWLIKGDWILEGMYSLQSSVYTKGYEASVFSSGKHVKTQLGISKMVTNLLGFRVKYEGEFVQNKVKGEYQSFLFESETVQTQRVQMEGFVAKSLYSLGSSSQAAPLLYSGLGVGRRIESYLLDNKSLQSFKNLLHTYIFFVGAIKPITDKIALNLCFNRHLYTDTFFVKGIPNSIVMSETVLKEWERDYELQFSIQFKF